jgi:hypothetical protein
VRVRKIGKNYCIPSEKALLGVAGLGSGPDAEAGSRNFFKIVLYKSSSSKDMVVVKGIR